MFQPTHPISGKAPFHNIIHTSNMFKALPDPAWTLGEAERHEMDHLRSDLRCFAARCITLSTDDVRDALTGFCIRIEQMVTDDAAEVGVSIATGLFNIGVSIDDHLFTLAMHESDDHIDLCYRAELQIASLIHSHFAAMEMADA